jgi:hypothetical protein
MYHPTTLTTTVAPAQQFSMDESSPLEDATRHGLASIASTISRAFAQ